MEKNLTLKKYKANTRSLTCQDCGKSFSTPTILKRHILIFHLKQSTSFVCDGCSKSISSRANLQRHQERHCPSYRKNSTSRYSCSKCPATFKNSPSYNWHQRKSHNATVKLHKCAICFEENEKKAILTHYVKKHKIKFRETHHKFKSMKEFFPWKTTYENETNSKYIQKYNKQNKKDKTIVYSCANVHNSINRPDCQKSQLKIERYLCPAEINANVSSGKVTVRVIETHLGHSEGHITDESETIDEKKELPEESPILDDTDLKDAFDLCTNMDNCDDSLAVDLWIKDLQLNNSVLFYKAEGCLFEGFDELKLDDFVLIIMSTLQEKILQKYPSNIIYIDWYQAKNNYLATVLITDDKGEVFPCGFLVANKINKSILKVFLQHVKFKIGMQLRPNVLMTSLDNRFLEAWIEVMGQPQPSGKNLVWTCPWHVQEDWRKWLNVSFVEYEKKKTAYQKLQTLLNVTDQKVFSEQLSTVQTYLSQFKPLHTFANHFKNNMKVNYVTNPMRWSLCNSKLTQESKKNFKNMHRTLKSALWMGQKANNRVDKTVGAIMRLVRDKSVNLISEEELQNIKELIRVNHEKSLEIDLGFVITSEKGGWSVLSSDQTKRYEVKKVKDQCKCEVRCEECDSCLHQYVCSCVDASFSYNMCKHIHLFCRKSCSLDESSENMELLSSDDENYSYNSEENMDSPSEENIDSSLEQNMDSSLEENVDSSSDENVDSLADQDYDMTPHQDNRDKLLADFQKMVDSASPEEMLIIQRGVEDLEEQLRDVKKRKILHST